MRKEYGQRLLSILSGTYAGMNITADGTATALITFRADGTNVLINSPYVAMIGNINVEGGNYVTVEGFIPCNPGRIDVRPGG